MRGFFIFLFDMRYRCVLKYAGKSIYIIEMIMG